MALSEKNLEHLEGSFRALGWNDAEIARAVKLVKANPKKMTVVMPAHYKKEADFHARNTCKYVENIHEKDPDYKEAHAFFANEYLTEAYNNSRGVDEDDADSTQKSNPSTPRAEAAFQASILYGENNPYKEIIKKLEKSPNLNVRRDADKFRKTLKSGGMTLAHLYLKHKGNLNTRSPSFPEKSIKTQPTSYQFLAHKMAGMSPEARNKVVREVGHNNFMRQIFLATILKVCEPIFKIDYLQIEALTKEKMRHLPASVYNDRFWLDAFAKILEYSIRKDMRDINLENIILDAFKNLNDLTPNIASLSHLSLSSEPATPAKFKDPEHALNASEVHGLFPETAEMKHSQSKYEETVAAQIAERKQKAAEKINDSKIFAAENKRRIEEQNAREHAAKVAENERLAAEAAAAGVEASEMPVSDPHAKHYIGIDAFGRPVIYNLRNETSITTKNWTIGKNAKGWEQIYNAERKPVPTKRNPVKRKKRQLARRLSRF